MRNLVTFGYLITSIFLLHNVAFATEPDITVRRIGLTSLSKVPDEIATENLFYGINNGVRIIYFLECKNLIGVNSDSLHVKSVVSGDGKELLKNKKEKFEISLDHYNVRDDGKSILLFLDLKKDLTNKLDNLKIDGDFTVLYGTKKLTENATIPSDIKAKTKIGKFTLTRRESLLKDEKNVFVSDEQQNMPVTALVLEAPCTPDTNPYTTLQKMEIIDGKNVIEPIQSPFNGLVQTYIFKKQEGDLTIRLSYWEAIENRKLSLNEAAKK